MDITVLFKLTYGLYVVGAYDELRPVGCIINTCFQVTSQNPILAISLNKNNYTLKAIKESRRFSLSIIAEETDTSVIGTFGFQSSRDADKYEQYGYRIFGEAPCVNGVFAGRLILDAINFVDNETHVVVLARLVDTIPGTGKPMTYDYYHRVVKGKAPKNAPTYVAEEEKHSTENKADKEQTSANGKKKYKCQVCGYEVEVDGELPDDFKCPLCKQPKEKFSLV